MDLGFGHLLQLSLGDETGGDRLGLDLLGVEAAAVVGDADDDVAALVIGGQADGALLALAGSRALGGGLQAMVGGVAHHVGERVLDQVEHLAVELGVGAVHLQLDLLAQFAREVAHDAGQFLPGVADRLHPRLHDAFLQLGGDVGEPLQRHLELGVLVAAGDLQQLVAGQDQLGDHGHQMFQRVHVDADRLVGDLVGFRPSSPSATTGRFAAFFGASALARRGAAGLAATTTGAASVAVSRKARSSSSSETSPGRNGRSSVWSISVPWAASVAAELRRSARAAIRPPRQPSSRHDIAAMPRSTMACSLSIRSRRCLLARLRSLQGRREFP